jgi:hypothetical protein
MITRFSAGNQRIKNQRGIVPAVRSCREAERTESKAFKVYASTGTVIC